ncbi:hypothetical protein J4440_05395 [Candidatus Woesearchaeota archaeon]|nr:hypothetical protein [Candidatus Woesearchaeota archaeon]
MDSVPIKLVYGRLKTEPVEYLYGVPRIMKKFLKDEINKAAIFTSGKAVDLRPYLSVGASLFGYITVAENYGYNQLGDYFFNLKIPDEVIRITVDKLEVITAGMDPRIHNLRDKVVRIINVTGRDNRWGNEIDLGELALELNRFGEITMKRGKEQFGNLLKGIGDQIQIAYERENEERSKNVLEFNRKLNS